MGYLYSIYSTEDRRLSILKHYDRATKFQFLKIKEALRYRNEHIITPNGDRNLSFQKLICLNDILNGGFYTKINSYSFYEPTWYRKENINMPEDDTLKNCIELFNINCISQEDFLSEIKLHLLIACGLTTSILFF